MPFHNQAPQQDTVPTVQKESMGRHYGGARKMKSTETQEKPETGLTIPGNNRVKSLEELEQAFQEYRTAQRGNRRSGKHKFWLEWRKFIIQTACAMLGFYLLLTCVIGITVVHGDSMKPALHQQDIAVIWRLSGEYREGDVVLFRTAGAEETLVKRVIAGPGDTVEILNETGQVMVNGVILIEDYIYAETHSRGENTEPITLGEKEYFVLGDNRELARDSRNAEIGAVKKGDILGKIVLLLRTGDV